MFDFDDLADEGQDGSPAPAPEAAEAEAPAEAAAPAPPPAQEAPPPPAEAAPPPAEEAAPPPAPAPEPAAAAAPAPAEEAAPPPAPAPEPAPAAAPAEAPAASPEVSKAPMPSAPSGPRKALKLDLGQLTEKNLGQLKKLNSATFPVYYQTQFYQDLLKYLDYSRLGFYADVLVGSICCRLEERSAEMGGRALYIMTLSVLKPYQRRNLASQLIRWAVDKAQSKEGQADDIQEIYLHVQTSNAGALAFYKTFGFEITEEIKSYYKKIEPPDCYVLRKALNGGKVPPPVDVGAAKA